MNVNTATLDASFVAMLAASTVRPVGYVESPVEAVEPFAVVYPAPTDAMSGSMGNPLDMGDIMYQVTCVGRTVAQTAEMEQRVIKACADDWRDISGCCGTPMVSRRGTLRVQDNMYNSILVITVKASAV